MDRHLSSPDVIASLQQGRFLVVGRAGMDLYPEPAGTRITEALSFVADLVVRRGISLSRLPAMGKRRVLYRFSVMTRLAVLLPQNCRIMVWQQIIFISLMSR